MNFAVTILSEELSKVSALIRETRRNERSIMQNIPCDDLLIQESELNEAIARLNTKELAATVPAVAAANNESKPCLCDSCQNDACEGMYPSAKVSASYTVHKCSGYSGTAHFS